MSDVESLLRLSNGAALHKALREQGVGVSYRTVARWIGATPTARPPAELMPALEAVFGIQKEAPPAEASGAIERFIERWESGDSPKWAEALTDRILEAIQKDRDAMAEQSIQRVLRRVIDGSLPMSPRDEGAPDTGAPPESKPARGARRKRSTSGR